jgi:hypothetical protein
MVDRLYHKEKRTILFRLQSVRLLSEQILLAILFHIKYVLSEKNFYYFYITHKCSKTYN